MTFDEYFFKQCETFALKSKDPSNKIGAVIVDRSRGLRSSGYNGIPRGVDDSIAYRHERPEKYIWYAHAEANAIYNAARAGTCVDDCSLYVPRPACAQCVGAMIQSGIREVVHIRAWYEHEFTIAEHEISQGIYSWRSTLPQAQQMMTEAGIELRLVEIEV